MSLDPSVVTWASIDPLDIDVLEFDFRVYAAGTPIASMAAQVQALRGAHAQPEQILMGSATEAAGVVYQRVHQALEGVAYKVRMRAVFADGRAQVLAGILPCVRR